MGSKVEIVNTRNDSENILMIGGSRCDIMQLASSFIITDPKGELCRDTARFHEYHGYDVIQVKKG